MVFGVRYILFDVNFPLRLIIVSKALMFELNRFTISIQECLQKMFHLSLPI